MTRATYKHFATISSQVYFCASPIRLDSYNRCQFGCTYCFSRNRTLDTSAPGLKVASVEAFARRLERVAAGKISSAFDEFLAARVPLQFGGTQDPFSGLEVARHTTLALLRVLQQHDYPTILSTKSTLPQAEPYLSILRTMNVMVRFSAAGVNEKYRSRVDVLCPPIANVLRTVTALSREGIPVSLRIQPVIPGHENAALRLARRAANAGVRHISFEFLKIGTEDRAKTLSRLSEATGKDVWDEMTRRGVKRIGRDYTLVTAAKAHFIREAKRLCRELNVAFGAGDTEFIHYSDGRGCCNGSSHFLRSSTQFRANFVGVLSNRRKGDRVYFRDLERLWHPELSVHSYLTTDSRGRSNRKGLSSWLALVAHRWNGGRSPYSPAFFHGVKWTGRLDRRGFRVYEISEVI